MVIVTYDKNTGGISVKQAIASETLVQACGGCLFVALPAKN
jgi:hypothetical protein